jgi:hypothetical protein
VSKERERKIIDSEMVCICLNNFQHCVTSKIRMFINNGRVSFNQKKYFISFLILDIKSINYFQEKKKRIFKVSKFEKYLFA